VEKLFDKGIFIMMMFVRGERENDWSLHLAAFRRKEDIKARKVRDSADCLSLQNALKDLSVHEIHLVIQKKS
jgi:hypothetical protein